jgi:hypothetical protein
VWGLGVWWLKDFFLLLFLGSKGLQGQGATLHLQREDAGAPHMCLSPTPGAAVGGLIFSGPGLV